MKATNLNILLTILVAGMMTSACVSKKNNNPSSSTTPATNPIETSGTPTTGSGSDSRDTGTGNQAIPYYVLPSIVTHGGSGVKWTSSSDPRLTADQGIFITDSRLNIRIKVKPSPGKTTDSSGASCDYDPLLYADYTKLQIKIGLRKTTSGVYYDSYTFDNVAVDSTSTVYKFRIPPGTSEPLVLEAYDVKWDSSCIDYKNREIEDTSRCPWDYVWPNDCVEFQIEMATDNTKDLPL